jgi:drug/metabolite transporter (DMT)-like permease
MSASSLGVTTYLVPPLTVLMAWLALDETPPLVAYAGGALCLAGVSLARRRSRRPALEPVAEPG